MRLLLLIASAIGMGACSYHVNPVAPLPVQPVAWKPAPVPPVTAPPSVDAGTATSSSGPPSQLPPPPPAKPGADAGTPSAPDLGTGAPPASVGAPCRTDEDCDKGLTCFHSINFTNLPGGYCTTSCGGNTACPTGSVCLQVSLFQRVCAVSCLQSLNDCRGGYVCCESASSSCVPNSSCQD
jgi:hypothetical protein